MTATQVEPQAPSHQWKKQPEIRSPEQAREIIAEVWIPTVEACEFADIQNRNQAARAAAVSNRRRILLWIGREAVRQGTIHPTVSLAAIEAATGINRGTVRRNLKAEVARRRFIAIRRRGKVAGPRKKKRVANEYKLLVDKMRAAPMPQQHAATQGATDAATDAATPSRNTPQLNKQAVTQTVSQHIQRDRAPTGALAAEKKSRSQESATAQGPSRVSVEEESSRALTAPVEEESSRALTAPADCKSVAASSDSHAAGVIPPAPPPNQKMDWLPCSQCGGPHSVVLDGQRYCSACFPLCGYCSELKEDCKCEEDGR